MEPRVCVSDCDRFVRNVVAPAHTAAKRARDRAVISDEAGCCYDRESRKDSMEPPSARNRIAQS